MTTNRLQLPLRLDRQALTQPLPAEVRTKSIAIIAQMLREVIRAQAREAHRDSR